MVVLEIQSIVNGMKLSRNMMEFRELVLTDAQNVVQKKENGGYYLVKFLILEGVQRAGVGTKDFISATRTAQLVGNGTGILFPLIRISWHDTWWKNWLPGAWHNCYMFSVLTYNEFLSPNSRRFSL